MQITVNGEHRPWRKNLDLPALLSDLGLTGKRLAIELNGEIIPRSQQQNATLNPDDVLEIVQAIGGG